ncbi:MAG: NosD domain-containing protein, partial [Candidatus Bathyarchaeota archaeon]
TNCFDGIGLYTTSQITVYRNTITDSRFGIASDDSTNNTISENTITNSEKGLMILNVSNITVYANTVADNEIGFSIYDANDNTFFHNNMINNTIQVQTNNATNTWDNGSEGNYWNDYIGVDADGDGIGDTPYVIDASNQDNYPLMTPYNANTPSTNKAAVNSASLEAPVTDPNPPPIESSPETNTETTATKEGIVKKLALTTDQQEQQEQQVIPEFPSWIIMPLFLAASLAVTVYKKKLN